MFKERESRRGIERDGQKEKESAEPSSVVCIGLTYSTDTDIESAIKLWYLVDMTLTWTSVSI